MRRLASLLAVLVLGSGLLSGCGSASMKRLGDPSGAHCPTKTTGTFAKERFSAHVGVAADTLRRWVWRPYREGLLDLGTPHRSGAVVRATASAHAAALEYRDAAEDVSVDPANCELMYSPLTDLANALDRLDQVLHGGDQARIDRALTGLHEAVLELRTLARSTGVHVTGPEGPMSGHRHSHSRGARPRGQHTGQHTGQYDGQHDGDHDADDVGRRAGGA